jgi:hypothetical protein
MSDSIKAFRKSVSVYGNGEEAHVYFMLQQKMLHFKINDLFDLYAGRACEIPAKVGEGVELFSVNKLQPVEGILKRNLRRFREMTA